MLVTIIQVVVTIGVALFLIFFIRNMLQNKRNRHLEQEVRRLAKQHDQLLSEVLEPYHTSTDLIKLTRGETKERYEELSERFLVILNTAKEAQQNLEGLRITKDSYGSVLAVLPRAEQQLTEEFEKLSNATKQLQALNQEDKQVSAQMKEEKSKLEQLRVELQSLQQESGYSLQNLQQKFKHVSHEFSEVSEQVERLDFIAAVEELTQVKESIAETSERLNRMKQLLKKENEVAIHVKNEQNEELNHFFDKFKVALEAGEVDKASHFMQKAFKEAQL
ncbi:hypothetical protein [Alkalicoccobacillus porphyridii]|uniref:Uncharacterized protein n=1 Tax=Alkalicoccobacillus porphyridii TaxID=2597270 RepID=A0A553ZWG7_9BACI|nr:hypothetical protein [Alkalicoccobacillus porphyridii]TSB45811.1 hypothetical protein FN960_15125 [Alkalicoccobacillus porphyridii]